MDLKAKAILEAKAVIDEFDKGNRLENYQKLSCLIEKYCNVPELIILFIQISNELGYYDRSKSEFLRYLKLTKKEDLTKEVLCLGQDVFSNNLEFEESINYGKKILEFYGEDYTVLGKMAVSYSKIQKFLQAIVILEHLEANGKLTAGGYIKLIHCQEKINQGISDAINTCVRGIKRYPENAFLRTNAGKFMCMVGNSKDAILHFDVAKRIAQSDPLQYSEHYSNYLLVQNYIEGLDPQKITDDHLAYSKAVNEEKTILATKTKTSKKIHLGFVSPDFMIHPVAFFLFDFLGNIDCEKFEVYLYANLGGSEDQFTEKFKELCNYWCRISGMSTQDVKQRIIEDKIDVLIDLCGHTALNRLDVFSSRSAPVQISWLGYPNTTGLKNMDYRIVDSKTDPVGTHERYCSEKLIRIDPSFINYSGPQDKYNVNPNNCESVSIFYNNNIAKLTDGLISLIKTITDEDENINLVVKSNFSEEKETSLYVRSRFTNAGISEDRVTIINNFTQHSDYINYYNSVDITLDPFPYNGTTSTCESLYMGVPVVTLEGDRHVSRVGNSILRTCGLDYLIAQDLDTYVKTVLELAKDKPKLTQSKFKISKAFRESSVMDAVGFTRKFEKSIISLVQN